MEEKNVLKENELNDVNGGGVLDFIKDAANRKGSYICDNCKQRYEALVLTEAAQYATLGKHLCPSCKD